MRWWLIDPSGLLHRLLPLVSSVEEATSFVRYFGALGQLLTDGKTGLALGTNEVAALLSFSLEERAGVDLKERYRSSGASGGQHGMVILVAARIAPIDPGWADRLRAVGLEVVSHREAGRYAATSWEIELSHEDI